MFRQHMLYPTILVLQEATHGLAKVKIFHRLSLSQALGERIASVKLALGIIKARAHYDMNFMEGME